MLKMQVVTALGTIIIYFVSKYSTMKIQTLKKIYFSSIPLVCDNKYFLFYFIVQFYGPPALPISFKLCQTLLKISYQFQSKTQMCQTLLMMCCQTPVKIQPCQAHDIGARTVLSLMEYLVQLFNYCHPSARLLDLIMIEIVGNLMDWVEPC